MTRQQHGYRVDKALFIPRGVYQLKILLFSGRESISVLPLLSLKIDQGYF